LATGDNRWSGVPEIGLPDELAFGLLEPESAQVFLAIHSHGPASEDPEVLEAQLTSFTGGCDLFLGGADGIADGPEDIPTQPGECSTIQVSMHDPAMTE
jgi:hypothetical protein